MNALIALASTVFSVIVFGRLFIRACKERDPGKWDEFAALSMGVVAFMLVLLTLSTP